MGVEIDHIGIAVASIDESLKLFRDLIGLPVSGTDVVAAEQVKATLLTAGTPPSAPRIELLEATSESCPIARFLKSHGPGLHHIALRVKDLSGTAARLTAAGYQLLNEPKLGAGGHAYVFIHPRSTGGILLELVEDNHAREGAV